MVYLRLPQAPRLQYGSLQDSLLLVQQHDSARMALSSIQQGQVVKSLQASKRSKLLYPWAIELKCQMSEDQADQAWCLVAAGMNSYPEIFHLLR